MTNEEDQFKYLIERETKRLNNVYTPIIFEGYMKKRSKVVFEGHGNLKGRVYQRVCKRCDETFRSTGKMASICFNCRKVKA